MGASYLYDAQGNLKNRITKGPWHVDAIVDVDSRNRVVYFKANAQEKGDTTPYYEHLYRVNLDGSGLKLITPGDYFHLALWINPCDISWITIPVSIRSRLRHCMITKVTG